MSKSVETATLFPVGHVFDIEFPQFTPRIKIASESELSFEILSGLNAGFKETVVYQVLNIRPGLFIVSWQEKSKATVVHIEDFAQGFVHTNITLADGTLLRMNGKILSIS